MSDPLNSEILDVLSSIRRLVSEERKGVPNIAHAFPRPIEQEGQPQPEPARQSSLPQESRFVLTQALRVGKDEQPELEDEVADAAADVPPDPFASWDEDAAADDGPADDNTAGAEIDPAFAHAAAPAAQADASLETTIAELEAAVANIGADFEPDGGDAVEDAGDPIPAQVWSEPTEKPRQMTGFSGIIAGYEALSMTDERLDAPITGEVMYSEPAEPFATTWLRAAPTTQDARHISDPEPDMRPEDEDSLIAAQEAEEAENAAEDLFPVADDETLDHEAGDWHRAEGGLPSAEGSVAEYSQNEDGMTAATILPVAGRLHLDTEERARPRILRAETGQSDPDEVDLGADRGADDLPDGDDLLDPLAGDGIDISMLRDMVVEIIREELRGTLGERITRNVRGLVRREIARVLDDELRDGELRSGE